MGRKRIGVILSEAESYYQERLLRGVMTKAFQLDYDVLICQRVILKSSVCWRNADI